MKSIFNRLLGKLFVLFIFIAMMSCSSTPYRSCEGMIWNTFYHITYKGSPELEDSVMKVLQDVGKSLNVFDSTSLVGRLNRTKSIKADHQLLEVYETSRKINRISNGLFDPTISPLINAWGFGIGHTPTADTISIDSILQFVGIQKTRAEGDLIIKDDIRTQFNFSAIAKGYGCDAVGEMFKRNNVYDYMIEIGGELTLSGESPSSGLWKISVDAPVESDIPDHTSAVIIALTDKGVATSGNYRNFRKENGNKTAHTISPLSGRPYISDVLSATVIAETCMEADGLATACMASSVVEAKRILVSYGADGLLIFSDSVWMTPGFKNYINEEVSAPEKKDRN
ncbi:MAG: FAD:protein FMN transferase [Muribaculaceae bacterium]|nr:FAD:protein FMN transferase [Muribaculaceae bacterium]